MSDPVGNAEIEDVLSSIRRLVAGDQEDVAASDDPAPSAPTVSRATEEKDALVLTPSLRVEDEEAASLDEDGEAEAGLWEADAESEITAEQPPNAPDDDFPAVSGFVQASEPELDSEPELVESEPLLENNEELPEEEDTLPTFVRSLREPEGESGAEPSSQAPNGPFDGEGVGAFVSTVEAETPEAASAKPAPRAGFMFRTLEEDTELPGETEAVVSLEKQENEQSLSVGAPEVPLDPEPELDEVTPQVPEIENSALDGEQDDTFWPEPEPEPEPEPQLVVEIVSAETEDPWLDISSSNQDSFLTDVPEQDPSDDTVEDDGNLFSTQDLEIDEAALRDLVSEMLHRELQGALGERITRNVRKLVRREIHRALATRDFD